MKWTEEDKERLNEFINELLYENECNYDAPDGAVRGASTHNRWFL